MQILASALPGVRDLRAPLVAGYLWLLFIWLSAEPHVHRADASGVVAAAFHLGGAIGKVGIAAVVSVIAYLLGAVSQELSPGVRQIVTAVGRAVDPSHIERSAFVGLSEQMAERADVEQSAWLQTHLPLTYYLLRARRERLAERDGHHVHSFGHDPNPDGMEEAFKMLMSRFHALNSPEVASDLKRRWPALNEFVDEAVQRRAGLLDQVRDEMRLPANLIVGDHAELFAEIDRLRSESELRLAVVPPLMALAVFLAILVSPVWLASIPLIVMLAFQGTRRYQQSTATVANAAFFGKVQLASIAAYRDWVQQMAPSEPQGLSPDIEAALRSGSLT